MWFWFCLLGKSLKNVPCRVFTAPDCWTVLNVKSMSLSSEVPVMMMTTMAAAAGISLMGTASWFLIGHAVWVIGEEM